MTHQFRLIWKSPIGRIHEKQLYWTFHSTTKSREVLPSRVRKAYIGLSMLINERRCGAVAKYWNSCTTVQKNRLHRYAVRLVPVVLSSKSQLWKAATMKPNKLRFDIILTSRQLWTSGKLQISTPLKRHACISHISEGEMGNQLPVEFSPFRR